jgi:hypothetical protein
MRYHTLVLIATALVLSGQPHVAGQDGGDAARLIGNWRLVSFENFPEGEPSQRSRFDAGRLMYDAAGQIAAQLMQTPTDRTNPATPDARAAAYGRFLGYYGSYTVDAQKKIVNHHAEGSSYPHWVDTIQVRHYELSADGSRLALSLKNGERITGTLTWERIK